MRIAVYCSARADIPEIYHDDARALGAWIGRNGHTLVYGGLSLSMMGDVAHAAAVNGAKVIGLVPRARLQLQSPDNTVSILVEALHERKQMMEENADTFVALEGGIGTLDELFAALASSTFSGEPRQVHLLDRDGLYEPLRLLLEKMHSLGLVNAGTLECIHFHDSPEALCTALERQSHI